jgi:hypothetical protein
MGISHKNGSKPWTVGEIPDGQCGHGSKPRADSFVWTAVKGFGFD